MEKKHFKKIYVIASLFITGLCFQSFAQTGQIDLPRVTQMPNLPSPYRYERLERCSLAI